ncbi:MAG TPA: DUF2142 domain-containing protein, partial [Chthoniobacterales bacterium]|nr:DUF2142 domain-containing protein [Chthoniobacterales bacterium]
MRHERRLIFALCFLAALRVFVFSAAFPFFNNVDEQAHVDLVIKYSHGYLPRSLDQFSAESARYFAVYSSPDYFLKPAQFDGEKFPPPNWTLPPKECDRVLSEAVPVWQSRQNHESSEPPLYYALAGCWLNLGKILGVTDGCLLYWIRFLNIFIAAALVWLGFVAARLIFPDRHLPQIGVPLLLAVWPQSALYSVQSDALSPFFFGIAFIGLIILLRSESPCVRLGLTVGLALAATILTKTSNLPLLITAGAVLVFKLWPLKKSGRLRQASPSLIALVCSAAIPIGAWIAWNYHSAGDFTGTAAKIQLLDWTRKPIADWWHHPLFTLHGMKEFSSPLLASFWRGEFIWHGERLTSSTVDLFYWISSIVAVVVAAMGLWPRFARVTNLQRESLGLALLSFAALVGFLALLSIAFDFGDCPYPSRAHPFFTSGRLLNAAAIPFFLLYVCAIDLVTRWAKQKWLGPAALGAIALFVAISQCVVNWPAFASQYNFFQMW